MLYDPGPRKIRAIKIIRVSTGLGLKESKDVIDAAPLLIPQPSWEAAAALAAALTATGAIANPTDAPANPANPADVAPGW
jgi:large subunit ribosomal protein L7/L12